MLEAKTYKVIAAGSVLFGRTTLTAALVLLYTAEAIAFTVNTRFQWLFLVKIDVLLLQAKSSNEFAAETQEFSNATNLFNDFPI